MQDPPSYRDPPEFLEALAKRLHTTPDRVSPVRATEELIGWIERTAAIGPPPSLAFLRVALRLVYEHARLALGPARCEVSALADRLERENRDRQQSRIWKRKDWLKLARLLLGNRRLPLTALFREDPPTPSALIADIPLPFAARHVLKPLAPDAKRLPAAPLDGLCERAAELLALAAADVEQVRNLLEPLRAEGELLTRKPPGRTNSADFSQPTCNFRSKSAK